MNEDCHGLVTAEETDNRSTTPSRVQRNTAGRRRYPATPGAARRAGGWGAESTPTRDNRTQQHEVPTTTTPPADQPSTAHNAGSRAMGVPPYAKPTESISRIRLRFLRCSLRKAAR